MEMVEYAGSSSTNGKSNHEDVKKLADSANQKSHVAPILYNRLLAASGSATAGVMATPAPAAATSGYGNRSINAGPAASVSSPYSKANT